jgi:excisionase family DNA binding protein
MMSVLSTGIGHDGPLVCSPRRACELLDIGTTRLYELIAAGELQSFKAGKSRKITLASIQGYIAAQLAAQKSKAP